MAIFPGNSCRVDRRSAPRGRFASTRQGEICDDIYRWESSCQGTVPQALICFLDSENFEDAIRRAVSLGGDSDTLACITGGIAEAYYKEIPKSMADRVARPFPKIFHKILDAVREETVYGKTCKIVE